MRKFINISEDTYNKLNSIKSGSFDETIKKLLENFENFDQKKIIKEAMKEVIAEERT